MLWMILISAILALGIFVINENIGYVLIDRYIEHSDYIQTRNERTMDKVEQLVRQEDLAVDDVDRLVEYVDNVRAIYISIGAYQGGRNLLQDSGMDKDYFDMMDGSVSRDISFADGVVTIYLYGYFDSQLYSAVTLLCIVWSILLFILLSLFLIQFKIRYIVQLEREIKIIGGGGLDYEITVKGRDELASLAQELNSMRLALKENIRKESEAVQAKNRIVVGVAHDVRTPLTALMLYLDLLKKSGRFEADQLEYIEKSRAKAVQIKTMTDDLFERFLISDSTEVKLEEARPAAFFLEDVLSDLIGQLEMNGFRTDCEVDWGNRTICVSMDYIVRIMDNLCSNLFKYADKRRPIFLTVSEEADYLVVRLQNTILPLEEKMESTQVGVQNIRIMMERMGGTAEVEQNETEYVIALRFPLAGAK